MRIVGIVPAAGHASRLQPLTGSKEMIDVQGTPVVQCLLDGLRVGGCEELRLVTRPQKRDLVEYASDQGVTVVLATPASVSESLLAALEGVDDDDLVLSGFADTLWEPNDAFRRLRARHIAPAEVVLGLFEVGAEAECDRVDLDASGAVRCITVKPHEPDSSLTWGCFAAHARTLRGLDAPEPGAYFDSLCEAGQVRGLVLSDRYLDIGTPVGLDRLKWWFADSARLGSARDRT